MNQWRWIMSSVILVTALVGRGVAVSSSLYLDQVDSGLKPVTNSRGETSSLAPAIAMNSFTAVPLPEPRKFEVDDLITIIIRESAQTQFNAKLDTEKKNYYKGAITAFPNLRLDKLLQFQLTPSKMSDGPVKLGVTYDGKFNSTGEYQRQSSMTGRITARVIDVKPNGTLVLEARKLLKSDNETLEIVLTGTCRAQDVASDNTVLSTQLYDLNLTKKHEGSTRDATSKGLLSRLLDLLFNF